jgi:hypothetical protein
MRLLQVPLSSFPLFQPASPVVEFAFNPLPNPPGHNFFACDRAPGHSVTKDNYSTINMTGVK